MKKNIFLTAIVLFILSLTSAEAQFIEDALRFSKTQAYSTARAGALGVAYHGVSDDLAAIQFNPAGLSLVPKSEFSVGFGFRRNNTESDFIGNTQSFSSNDATLNHIGIVSPFKTSTGNAAIGIAYFTEQNFDNNYSFEAFNTGSSIIDYYSHLGSDLVTNQGLANSEFKTPINDSLTQKGFVSTSGGLHNITAAAGFDITKNFAAGFSVTGKFGSFDYTKDYQEIDSENMYNTFDEENWSDLDFDRLLIKEKLYQSVSGITAAVGVQARVLEFMRVSAKINFPTFYNVEEDFSTKAETYFDGLGTDGLDPYESAGNTSYNISTPWVYSGGISFHLLGMTFSAGVEYADVSQIEFTDAMDEIEDLNLEIVQQLIGQTTWGLGAEYKVPILPVAVRVSYSSITSPYTDDIAGATVNKVALGAGVFLGKIRIDGLIKFSDYSELHSNYASNYAGAQYVLNYTPVDFALQMTYRF